MCFVDRYWGLRINLYKSVSTYLNREKRRRGEEEKRRTRRRGEEENTEKR